MGVSLGPVSCADFNRLLELVEGKLDPIEAETTRLHVLSCPSCRMLLAKAEHEGSVSSGADPPPPVEIGESIGRYVITGWLGAGAMGVVLRAHDPQLQRDVALKVVARSAETERARAQVLREARHMARVSHPNVIGVFDAGTDGQRVFIAMEIVEGDNLARWLSDGERRRAEIFDVFAGAGRGLQAAHEAGLVHGDFKPANVLVGRTGEVKVVDFGLSRAAAKEADPASEDGASLEGSLEPGRALAGTPRYMAPELWIGKRPTALSDQFSFALALHEALSASRGGSEPPNPARGAAALVRAMSAEPSARFPSVMQLLASLHDEPAPTLRVARAPMRWLLGGFAAIALGLAVLLAVRRAPSPPSVPPPVVRATPQTMVDGPPVPTVHADAAETYRAALVAYHDASTDAGQRLLRRTLELDPDLAPAHLRLAVYGDIPMQERRQHVERANQLRTHLTESDQSLLEAMDRFVQLSQESYREYATRLAAASRRFPYDAELALLAAGTQARLALPALGTEVARPALELDPTFALAHLVEAEIAVWQADRAHAGVALARCLELAPAAASCMRLDAVVHGLAGECDAMKARALAMINADPEGYRAYALLAMAMAGAGAPPESVREALRTLESLVGRESGALPRLRDEAELASFDGDFATAQERLSEIDALPDVDYAGMAHEVAFERILVFEETGQTERALNVAQDYLHRFEGWPHGFWGRARPIALATLHRAGRISEAQFAAEQRTWANEERDKNLPIEANLAWVDFYARVARTRDEAKEALALLPENLPLPNPKGLHWNDDPIYILHREGIGRTLLLGARPQEALESLRMVSRSCMGLGEPVAYVQAQLELGEAHEALSETPQACEAYARVLERWGKARPRSVSAELARSRMAALRCP